MLSTCQGSIFSETDLFCRFAYLVRIIGSVISILKTLHTSINNSVNLKLSTKIPDIIVINQSTTFDTYVWVIVAQEHKGFFFTQHSFDRPENPIDIDWESHHLWPIDQLLTRRRFHHEVWEVHGCLGILHVNNCVSLSDISITIYNNLFTNTHSKKFLYQHKIEKLKSQSQHCDEAYFTWASMF